MVRANQAAPAQTVHERETDKIKERDATTKEMMFSIATLTTFFDCTNPTS
jgi:hypothetical protein